MRKVRADRLLGARNTTARMQEMGDEVAQRLRESLESGAFAVKKGVVATDLEGRMLDSDCEGAEDGEEEGPLHGCGGVGSVL